MRSKKKIFPQVRIRFYHAWPPGVAVLLGPDDGSWDVGGIGHITFMTSPGLLRDITAIILQVCVLVTGPIIWED